MRNVNAALVQCLWCTIDVYPVFCPIGASEWGYDFGMTCWQASNMHDKTSFERMFFEILVRCTKKEGE